MGTNDSNQKPKESSFFLYFDDEKKMKEVDLMLFGITLSEKYKKIIKRHLCDIDTKLTQGNLFYTILKILSVKNKIKNRKITMQKINDTLKGHMFGKLNIEKKMLERLSIKRKESMKKENIIVNAFVEKKEPPKNEPMPVFRDKPPKIVKPFEKQYSDFMPLITNVSPLSDNNKSYKQKTLNELIKKYKSLRDEIPDDIINEEDIGLSDNGVSFRIPSGVQVKKDENRNNNCIMDPYLCSNAQYIFFNKNKPEILFKSDNNDNMDDYNDDDNKIKLSDDNIFEISNIVMNSNLNMNSPEENNLVIIGPKIDNNIGINYKYINNNNSYIDPENIKIKKKTINNNNKQDLYGTTIQIYQSELDINNNNKIQSLLQELNINSDNIKDNFLFGYRIKLSELKGIDSPYVLPNDCKNDICFVEYNHQYFIPNEYINKDSNFIIECFCIPVAAYNGREKNMSQKDKEFIGKLLSPVNIGYAEVNGNDIKQGKYIYEIKNNGIAEPNSFIILDGQRDKMNSLNINNITGKDYSIGNDSYIKKKINKDFIDKAKNNPDIPEDVKNKYFHVCFDNETGKDFLFRPNEEMDENEFIRDISAQISNEEMQKIKNNKKYHFLPYCEKFIDERTLYRSQNLKCLSDEQKKYIVNNYKRGDWIYKMPEIKVKLLSKNLGVTKSKNDLSQLLYSTGDTEALPKESLNRENGSKLTPISDNSFNIFDMKKMHNMENFENFQWKTAIKFNNQLQMESFIKLLAVARQNINSKKNKKQNIDNNNNFDAQKIIEFDNSKKYDDYDDDNQINLRSGRGSGKCEINVEFVDFREDFQIHKDPTLLEVIVFIEGNVEKSILFLLKDHKNGFENSLLTTNEKIKNLFSKYNNANGKEGLKEYFPKKVKLSLKKFNNGQKKIILGNHLKTKFDFNKNSINNYRYEILVILSDSGEYYSPLDMNLIVNNKMCNKYELPVYKRGDDTKIYGCLGIDLYELDNSGQSFQERYEELNSKYLKEPLLVLKEKLNIDIQNLQNDNYHFGLYEPNVFRRKILNFIHNDPNLEVDPTDMDNNNSKDLDALYLKLISKCVILPKREYFASFKYYNIRKNYDINEIS
jgi:hypothetical protein